MTIILELENSANWAIKDSQFFTASSELLLPEYLSVNLTSNIIGVLVSNGEARDTWNWAGWSCQHIQLPFEPNSSSTVNWRKLWLKQKQLLIFPKLVTTYKLFIRFPQWFSQVSITVCEYTGSQVDNVNNQHSPYNY
jgi:hypothetical protein